MTTILPFIFYFFFNTNFIPGDQIHFTFKTSTVITVKLTKTRYFITVKLSKTRYFYSVTIADNSYVILLGQLKFMVTQHGVGGLKMKELLHCFFIISNHLRLSNYIKKVVSGCLML